MTNEQSVALRCILICLEHDNRTAAYEIQQEFRISQQDVANMTLGAPQNRRQREQCQGTVLGEQSHEAMRLATALPK